MYFSPKPLPTHGKCEIKRKYYRGVFIYSPKIHKKIGEKYGKFRKNSKNENN